MCDEGERAGDAGTQQRLIAQERFQALDHFDCDGDARVFRNVFGGVQIFG
jgi:hypothetical protein